MDHRDLAGPVVHGHGVPPGGLGLVERRVGAAMSRSSNSRPSQVGDPEGPAETDALALMGDGGRGQQRAHPAGDADGLLQADMRQDGDELLAAEAPDEIDVLAQAMGQEIDGHRRPRRRRHGRGGR